VLEADGRAALEPPLAPLDCSNSGTTMRLLAGVVASRAFETVLEGDESLSSRPMERVAEPLNAMGADVRTTGGRAPIHVRGGPLTGIEHRTAVPSAQVKSAVLLAALAAEGETTVFEPAPTRDHIERALAHLGAPIVAEPGRASVRAFQHGGLAGSVPGDVSSAAFLVAAGLLTGVSIRIVDVGVNPSRTGYLAVLERMGARVHIQVEREELGEPVGTLEVEAGSDLSGTSIEGDELPRVVDEVPMLALLAAHARGETWFRGASELRVKESDRLSAVETAVRALGGFALVEGSGLVIGGGGLRGGIAPATRDHRVAMATAVAALGAMGPVTIDGIEAAEVSFPAFVPALLALGARVEG
jgi:3-phosphoshikimate 1-carboxyvinyltransferase